MGQGSGKPIVFSILCTLYGVLILLGLGIFSEAGWVRQLKGGPIWQNSFAPLEAWLKGDARFAQNSAEDSLMIVDELRGPSALLVRDFSSLVFRSAHETEALKGRNVLLTKEGVHARLFLVEHKSWLEMQPNTLIVIDRMLDPSGGKSTLSLSVLAGQWNLKKIEGRGPSSDSSAPKILIQDFAKLKESEVANEVDLVPNPLWGAASSVEAGQIQPSLGSELQTLSQLLEDSSGPLEEAPPLEDKKPKIPSKTFRPGSLSRLIPVFVAETLYIASALKARRKGRSPAASAIGLSVALESASSAPGKQEFTSALAQVLGDYLELYLSRGECGMAKELLDNVSSSYPQNSERLLWEKMWTKRLRKSSCRS